MLLPNKHQRNQTQQRDHPSHLKEDRHREEAACPFSKVGMPYWLIIPHKSQEGFIWND
jgi:hypothetical protein